MRIDEIAKIIKRMRAYRSEIDSLVSAGKKLGPLSRRRSALELLENYIDVGLCIQEIREAKDAAEIRVKQFQDDIDNMLQIRNDLDALAGYYHSGYVPDYSEFGPLKLPEGYTHIIPIPETEESSDAR